MDLPIGYHSQRDISTPTKITFKLHNFIFYIWKTSG